MAQEVSVANAPVSFGAFEVTVGDPRLPDPLAVLAAVEEAGYEGIDLGPPGYLGTADQLAERLAAHRLRLAGGWVSLSLSEPDRVPAGMGQLRTLLDTLDAAGSPPNGAAGPRPTLADAGSDERRARIGRAQRDHRLGLPRDGWRRLTDGVERALETCRARGYEPSFHHHAATYVEAPWEIEELLERTDICLCLDTGHLLVGGGDPVQAIKDWGARINHVHLKDVRQSVIGDIVSEEEPLDQLWLRNAFCPLGEGDVDLDGVLQALRARRYRGWLVVEQDTLPTPDRPVEVVGSDQARNRDYLRARGF